MQTRKPGQFSSHLALINKLATAQAKTAFELGRELSIIKEHALYTDAGFGTWEHFVASSELRMVPNTAKRLVKVFDNLKRLGYSQVESKQLMQQFTPAALANVLPSMDRKAAATTIARRVNKPKDMKMLGFSMSDEELIVIDKALCNMGMEIDPKTGRRYGAKDAFVQLASLHG